MVFNELREAIVTRLKEAMPKEVDVAGHPGVIDTAELGRLCMAAPALRVSVLKVLGVDRARGNDAAELQIGVYIVAGAGKGGAGAPSPRARRGQRRELEPAMRGKPARKHQRRQPVRRFAPRAFRRPPRLALGRRMAAARHHAAAHRFYGSGSVSDRSRRRKGSRAVERSARGVPAARAQAQNRAGRNRRTAYLLRRHHRRERRKP